MKDLFNNDSSFWPDFIEGTSGTQVPTQGVRATQVSSQSNEATQVPMQPEVLKLTKYIAKEMVQKKLHSLQRWLRKSSRKSEKEDN